MDTDLFKAFLAGQARHALTGAAGALVAAGAIKSDQAGAFVQIGVGIVVYLAGAAWSWWQKDGQAAVAAQLARLRAHVVAIPRVTNGTAAEATTINNAITAAKFAA